MIKVIIPAYNEAESIPKVIHEIPDLVDEVIVVNNGSSDDTAKNAKDAGATVVNEARSGYGYACLAGMDYIASLDGAAPDIIVFLDGDYSDYPEELSMLVEPIQSGAVDMVIGARVPELRAANSMTPQQVFGNWLATTLMRILFRAKFTDLGPFRAIRYDRLLELSMEDKTYGWTVEMQLKALKNKLKYTEVPVKYRNRIGVSKVSGTVKGSIMAGIKILTWIFKYSFK